jgi:acyl-CoA synthetase (AMP-forming)/AMP-acid ligase II
VDVNVGDVHDALAAAFPDREALVFRDRRFTWAQTADRTRRLGNHLHARGLGCHRERDQLEPWESGQDHLGIYCYNGNEYLEAMLGAFKARVAPFNVNYRYRADELQCLLLDARAAGLVYHSTFAPAVASIRDALPRLRVLVQVPDASGEPLLPGAEWYEDALAGAPAHAPPVSPSPDDLYILYTGGTMGRPKGVLWRQADAFTECFGGVRTATTLDDVVAAATTQLQALIAPPFMHGAGQWVSFLTWFTGGTVFVPPHPERLEPASVWRTVEQERVTFLLVVGDAFVRPLLDELERRTYDLTSLTVLLSGGAPLAPPLKHSLLAHLPALMIVDGLGASETGGQLTQVSTGGCTPSGTFPLAPDNVVLSEDRTRVLEPGDDELGWLAKRGRLALGYLGDPSRTAETYPVVDGVRYAVAGDRARLRLDGMVEVRGRDSATINTGGEKVFAEEVEAALRTHPDVYDCVVAGRPSERWGSEVVAVVQLRQGCERDEDALLDAAAERISRYKLPKAFVFVDEVVRSPSGKPDYRWARAIARDA